MYPRRELFRRGAMFFMASQLVRPNITVAEEPNNQIEKEQIAKITKEFILASKKMGGVEALGYRLNDAWKESDGQFYIAYQGGLLKRDDEGRITTWSALDAMRHLDDELDSGALGFQIPHYQELDVLTKENDDLFDIRAKSFNLPDELVNLVQILKKEGLDPGLPTSFSGDYGDFQVWRFNNMAFQRWKEDGRIERVLVGELAFKIGMVREEKQVITPQYDIEPEFAYKLRDERYSPTSRGVRTEGCEPTNVAWEGTASYYSSAGCMGCSINQVMANGEIFNENALTTAFMRTNLNRRVLVISKDTGIGVVVRVTDRGHFENWGRVADLSMGTARALGVNLRQGLFPVRIILLNC
jgi:hypothetical protein